MTYQTRRGGFVVYLDVIYVRDGQQLAVVRGGVRDWLSDQLPHAAALGELDALAESMFIPGVRFTPDITIVGTR